MNVKTIGIDLAIWQFGKRGFPSQSPLLGGQIQ